MDPAVRDVVAQRHVAETGYTAHLSGMYSDKFIHPRVQCDSGRYISIGCVRRHRPRAPMETTHAVGP